MIKKRPSLETYLQTIKSGKSQLELSAELKSQETKLLADFDQYTSWLKTELLKLSQSILITKIESDPDMLLEHLNDLLTIAYNIETEIMYCSMVLTIFETLHFQQKTKENSDLDRKRWVDTKTLEQKSLLNYLKGLSDLVNKKITAAQSFLKYQTTKLAKGE